MEDDTITAQCIRCSWETNHNVLRSFDYSWSIDEHADVHEEYQVIICCGCNELSFRRVERYVPKNGEPSEAVTLYPDRSKERVPIQHHGSFPLRTLHIYKEVLVALNAALPILAAIGLRGLIESICIEQKTKSKNLSQRIDELAEMDFLSPRQAEFLHLHRFMGNVAAHDMVAPQPQELEAALEIAETLLKTIYVLPRIAKSIKGGAPCP